MKSVLNYFVRKAFGFKSTATAADKTLFGHLLRIRQNIQGVYDWLYPKLRGSADGTILKRMPMTEAVVDPNGNMGAEPLRLRPVLQNSDTLLAHLRLLDGRKISNGVDDGVPDGISLARLMCSDDVEKQALIDDNTGWNLYLPDKLGLHHVFRNIGKKVVLGCESIEHNFNINNGDQTFLKGTFEEGVYFPHLKTITGGSYHSAMFEITAPILDLPELEITDQCRFEGAYDEINMPKFQRVGSRNDTGGAGYHAYQDLITSSTLKHLVLPSFNYLWSCYYYDTAMIRCAVLEDISLPTYNGDSVGNCVDVLAKSCPELREVIMPKCERKAWNLAVNCPKLEKVVFGTITGDVKQGKKGGGNDNAEFATEVNLIHMEFGEGSKANINIGNWAPTTAIAERLSLFLDNFLHFIAERVAEGNYTLTLSAAVYAALEQQEGQTILALLNTKGWTVASA